MIRIEAVSDLQTNGCRDVSVALVAVKLQRLLLLLTALTDKLTR